MPRGSYAIIEGDRRVEQLLSEMSDRARGVAAAWPAVGDVVAEHMAEQFATEGSHLTGSRWAPLTPGYLRWKVAKGYHPEILRQTDAMVSGLISRPMAVERYREYEAEFGTDDKKAPFHQHGTRFMAQRKIVEVDVNPDLADDVNSTLARYIFENRLDP